MRIAITGATGLIGSALTPALAKSHIVVPMVRGGSSSSGAIQWTPGQPLNPNSLREIDAVIHLAGRNIGTRWTAEAKREIVSSRVEGTRTIAQGVAETYRRFGRPTLLISTSAIGYYGSRGDELLQETSSNGAGFLADTVRAWEGAAQPAVDAGVRTVFPRFGVILSARGGALPRMLPPFRFGVGGRIGTGRQWMSWVSISDVVAAIEYILATPSLSGPVNVVGPNPLTNADFTRVLARVLHRPAIFPAPAFAIRLALGEMGEELLLSSARVAPSRLQQSGYKFIHPDAESAIRAELDG